MSWQWVNRSIGYNRFCISVRFNQTREAIVPIIIAYASSMSPRKLIDDCSATKKRVLIGSYNIFALDIWFSYIFFILLVYSSYTYSNTIPSEFIFSILFCLHDFSSKKEAHAHMLFFRANKFFNSHVCIVFCFVRHSKRHHMTYLFNCTYIIIAKIRWLDTIASPLKNMVIFFKLLLFNDKTKCATRILKCGFKYTSINLAGFVAFIILE